MTSQPVRPAVEPYAPLVLWKSDAVPRRRETGRNDPCPCGSGKKYKRCCL